MECKSKMKRLKYFVSIFTLILCSNFVRGNSRYHVNMFEIKHSFFHTKQKRNISKSREFK